MSYDPQLNVVEACVGAWLHNKDVGGEVISDCDEGLVERLHREFGSTHFRAMIADIRGVPVSAGGGQGERDD